MTVCPHCGQLNETGRDICRACGAALTTPEQPGVSQKPAPIPIPDVKIRDYFKVGWELFKKYPGGFVGYFIILVVGSLVLEWVPIIGPLVSIVLVTPLNAGFFVVSAKLLKNQHPEFSDFFIGLRFFQQLAFFGVISTILIVIGIFLLVVPGIYLIVGYTFALMFIVDQRLDFWSAMEASRRSVQSRWLQIFALLLLLLLLNLGGVLLLGVGLFVTAPLTHCIIAAAYADIFGLHADFNILTQS
jgi:uncharacterized membrane protein